MNKKITLRLDPWSQLALWLVVLLLAADRIRVPPLLSSVVAQDSSTPVISVNLVQLAGSKVDPASGLPVRQVGPPPTSRIGPGNFPFQKVGE